MRNNCTRLLKMFFGRLSPSWIMMNLSRHARGDLKKEGKRSNIPIECFVSRMKAKHAREVLENQQLIKKGLPTNEYLYKIPEPGERFSYIVIEPEVIYDKYGTKIPQQKGDCMEYVDVVKKFNKK